MTDSAIVALLDLNVWFALTQTLHTQNSPARIWFDQQPGKSVAFCRITQVGLLRLLTQTSAMRGSPHTQREAWNALDRLVADPRVLFLNEPTELGLAFRQISDRDEVAPKRWADDYLIAFAQAANLRLVTFDGAMAARTTNAILLTP